MSLNLRNLILYSVLILCIGGLFLGLVLYPIYGADFYNIFYPSARAVWEGHREIFQPGVSDGFYNPAHAMYYWMLISLAPLPVANAIQFFLTVCLGMATAHLWRTYSRWDAVIVTLALANPFTIDHLIRGQTDVLAVFGLILAFIGAKKGQPYLLGLGATISMVKPTNLILPLLFIAWSLRHWHWREILKASVIPLLTFFSTLVIFGFDWPLLYLDRVTPSVPYTVFTRQTIWILAETAQLPIFVPMLIAAVFLLGVIKYRAFEARNLALVITTTFLVTNYAAGYHYVALVPAIMFIRSRKWVFFCWLLSFLTFLRAISFTYSWLSLLYPVAVYAALLWQIIQEEREAKAASLKQAAELPAVA